MKYVKIGITVPKNNPYEDMLNSKNQPPECMAQWEQVANVLNTTTKIGITMSPKNLFQDLFNL